MKKMLSILLALCMLLGLGAAANAEKEYSEISVVAVLVSATSSVTSDCASGMQAWADANGVKLTVMYYENSISDYINMLENAKNSGTDVIICQNTSEQDAIDVLTEIANDPNIVLCCYDVEVPVKYDFCFTASNYDLGRAVGEMAAEWANKNLVANGKEVICGIGDYSISPIAHQRYQGTCDALKEGCPEAQIVMTAEMAFPLEGIEAGENFLQAYPNMNIVCGINDQSVCGVYETFIAAGKGNETIGMFSIDGIAEALYNIYKGDIYGGCVDQDQIAVGAQMVQYSVEKVAGVAEREPVQYFPRVKVTAENIGDYMEKFADLIK